MIWTVIGVFFVTYLFVYPVLDWMNGDRHA